MTLAGWGRRGWLGGRGRGWSWLSDPQDVFDHICLSYPRTAAMAIILAADSLCFDDEERLYSSEILGILFSIPNAPQTCPSNPSELR